MRRKFQSDSKSAKTFAHFFKKYLTRSSLDSLESFGDGLAELGVALDSSTFSHWKCGSRLPRNRRMMLLILKVFFEHQGLTTTVEANTLLEAAYHGHLTPEEERLVFSASVRQKKPKSGPIFLSSVHLVLPSNLLIKVEALAAEQGVSRTTMINTILEEKLL